MILKILLCTSLFATTSRLALAQPLDKAPATCGYESCHKTDPTRLNVHLVPHSHDDVGWQKTVDQYFYGAKSNIRLAGVRYIIDSVVDALRDNPDRKFIQVETAFFWKWWQQQHNATKEIVKDLVNNGQLEIIGGGWSMNDEAVVNYQSVIDQFTLGLKTIKDTLGECGRPKIGWQIDPFGHTREMASIFAQLGYDGVMFARLDYRDATKRNDELNTEFIWRGSPDLGKSSDLFTSLVYRFYDAPSTFCWDVVCGDEPMIDDQTSPLYNIDRRVNEFTEYIEKQRKVYKTNNILITMGGDFTYQAAQMYYSNIDKLIEGFRHYKNETYNLIYSTPSCYIKAVNDHANATGIKYSLKTDDFIPYASDSHTYWSGYYTSRPNSKRFEREANNLLQVTKQLTAFEKVKNKDFTEDLQELKEIVGIMQHHDAITGTEKQHVTDDYVRLLTKGSITAQRNISLIIHDLMLKKGKKDQSETVKVNLVSCLLANVTHCEESNSNQFVVVVYNPLSRNVSHYVSLPVTGINYNVTLLNGTLITYQASPSIDGFSTIQGIKPSSYELVFKAENLPPMGLQYYVVKKLDSVVNDPDLIKETKDKLKLGTNDIGFELDSSTKFIKIVTVNNVSYNVNQKFLYYSSAEGDNKKPENRASGAYIFRPKNPLPIMVKDSCEVKIYTGELFDEAHQTFDSWVKQIIRVYKDENHIEFNWLVGPIDYKDDSGVEVISRFATDFKSNKIFYTDTNGRGLIKRTRDNRETFNYTDEESVSGNYCPITSRIVLKDGKREFAVLTDRAQGGSSLKDSEIELMVHRRLKNDDGFGVDEVLDEKEFGKPVVVRGKHFLVIGTNELKDPVVAKQHDVALRKLVSPWTFVGKVEDNVLNTMKTDLNTEFSGILKELPKNVNILTLEAWDKDFMLLRLEHLFEGKEDANLSATVEIDLNNLFTIFDITSIQETTLGANENKENNKKLSWVVDEISNEDEKEPDNYKNLIITLKSMEIRTFIMRVVLKPEPKDNSASFNTHYQFSLLLCLFVYFLY